jgi:hypothetical protein
MPQSGEQQRAARHARLDSLEPMCPALVEAAQAAARTKHTYLRENFRRLRVRRGYKRAIVAIAHKILWR